MERFDDAVVGAGIVGLAHAYHLAKAGRKVVVFERGPKASGASVRNFGMIWPIGQRAGENYRLALRSSEIWKEVLAEAKLWSAPIGSLHLAYAPDEMAVLNEFANGAESSGYKDVSLLNTAEVLAKSQAVKPEGLLGGMFSSTEINVDPRQVLRKLPSLLREKYDVAFYWNTTVTQVVSGRISFAKEAIQADHCYVCSGSDLQTLYPEVLGQLGLRPCKLQMLKAKRPEANWNLGPMLAAGLTLQHYAAFSECATLPVLRTRIAESTPEFNRFGIHVMVSQNSEGDLILGDSHVYGENAFDPFDSDEIDRLILQYLSTYLLPPAAVIERWNGLYAKHPETIFCVEKPEPMVTCVTGLGGAGMTLSFGVAEQVVSQNLDRSIALR